MLYIEDSSHVEGFSVNLQIDMVTVQVASLSASPSRLVIFWSSSRAKRLCKLMAILVDWGYIFNWNQMKKTVKQVEKQY